MRGQIACACIVHNPYVEHKQHVSDLQQVLCLGAQGYSLCKATLLCRSWRVVYNCLLDVYARTRRLKAAQSLFDVMRRNGPMPCTACYNAYIRAHANVCLPLPPARGAAEDQSTSLQLLCNAQLLTACLKAKLLWDLRVAAQSHFRIAVHEASGRQHVVVRVESCIPSLSSG